MMQLMRDLGSEALESFQATPATAGRATDSTTVFNLTFIDPSTVEVSFLVQVSRQFIFVLFIFDNDSSDIIRI